MAVWDSSSSVVNLHFPKLGIRRKIFHKFLHFPCTLCHAFIVGAEPPAWTLYDFAAGMPAACINSLFADG